MRKSKMITTIIWFLVYGLSMFFLFLIPDTYTNVVWTTIIFDSIAFISQLILWLTDFCGKTETFYQYPSMSVSSGYLFVQFVLCLISAFFADTISFKLNLVLNVILLVIAWVLLILTIFSVNHIQKINLRQIDHHVKLQ